MINNNDLVSVIITTYKRPQKILFRALNSVINQTYKNIEIIIVDDSPQDYMERYENERTVYTVYGKNVKYIMHPKNLGACAARNTGISESNGKYIAFLDDDDEWFSTKIEKQLEKLKEKNAGLVYCSSYVINEVLGKKFLREYKIEGFVFDKLIINNFIASTSLVMVTREALDNCGYFNLDMLSAQDCELWLRIAKKYFITYVAEPLVNYYIHKGDSITKNIYYKMKGLEKLNDINIDYLKAHRKAYAVRLLKIIPFYVQYYGKFYAIKKWIKAFFIYPFYANHFKYLKNILLG